LASQNSDQINIAKKLKLKQKKTPEFLKLPSVCVRRTEGAIAVMPLQAFFLVSRLKSEPNPLPFF